MEENAENVIEDSLKSGNDVVVVDAKADLGIESLGRNKELKQVNNFKEFNFEANFEGMIYEDLGYILVGRVGYLPVGWDANGKCIIGMVEDKSKFDLKLMQILFVHDN